MVRLSRISVVHLTLVLFAVLLIGQSAKVQLFQGKQWAERARQQQFKTGSIAAPRGKILDASGNVLAESRELVRLNIAPGEVKNADALAIAMREARIDPRLIRSSLDRSRKWVTLPGLYVATEVARLTSFAGVHPENVLKREYVSAAGIQRLVGSVDARGFPLGGIELTLDTILKGDSARATIARDVSGRRLYSPETGIVAPRAGSNIVLTIYRDLQEICERALAHATDSLKAKGGDIVVLNPATGEILAMASVRLGRPAQSVTAVTEPFEPGSTVKPFIAAALLERDRARSNEVVDTNNGIFKLGSRTITDTHEAWTMTLADVLKYSSNIGIVKFGARLSRRETFETYRDLGFGAPTGVPIPGEAEGILREPARWEKYSAASLAMGYEMSVTPLQLVSAYAALANGGVVVQPHIVREIRDADGELLYRARPRALRRVFRDEVTREIRRLMRSVVDSGTAVKADLATFQLAGKSGTARRTSAGAYVAGDYTASFVGLFPAERPQYVVLVKLDSPRGVYYGGETAAPVTAVVLRAALAARDAALDRAGLANEELEVPLTAEQARRDSIQRARKAAGKTSEFASLREPGSSDPAISAERTPRPARLMTIPFTRPPIRDNEAPRAVPDVAGLSTRTAVRALHRAGFRVLLVDAQNSTTIPASGALLAPGSVVKLRHIQ